MGLFYFSDIFTVLLFANFIPFIAHHALMHYHSILHNSTRDTVNRSKESKCVNEQFDGQNRDHMRVLYMNIYPADGSIKHNKYFNTGIVIVFQFYSLYLIIFDMFTERGTLECQINPG